MKILTVVALLATAPAALTSAVQYYLIDHLNTVDSTKWSAVGSPSPNAVGLSNATPNAGSLISKVKIPDGSSEVEVLATLTLVASGGVYTEFVQATADAHTANVGSGAYIAFEMQNPKFDSTGHCLANFLVLQSSAAGTVSLLSSFQHACRNGMQMRLAAHGNLAFVWPDQATPIEFQITPQTGQPGIGTYSTPPGNAFSLVQLGSIARSTPAAVVQGTIGVSAFRNRTDIKWQAVLNDPSGPGLAEYWVFRDGNYLLRTTATQFSDEAVTAGAQHTYTVYAVDQHYNQSPGTSVTVNTPMPHK